MRKLKTFLIVLSSPIIFGFSSCPKKYVFPDYPIRQKYAIWKDAETQVVYCQSYIHKGQGPKGMLWDFQGEPVPFDQCLNNTTIIVGITLETDKKIEDVYIKSKKDFNEANQK